MFARLTARLRTVTPDAIIQQVLTLVRFVFMAALGFSINFSLTVLLHEKAGFPEQVSFACGLLTVFVFNFIVFRKFVFKASRGDKRKQLKRFFWTSVIFRSSEWGVFSLVVTLSEVDYRVVVIAILALSMLSKFVIYRVFVFRDEGEAEHGRQSDGTAE